ncbi:sarcosine oxidase subunit gamma [Arthrobacter cheniae]|uniref:Sarcosine oxidase subunit gamma n=1 Tax=Arthrobacter cheniae TaxID=1258888 RepID=A0A3A5M699_9MICC|nr:sarcosine oxidase subunit gamma [Arthrobacter cheniae]
MPPRWSQDGPDLRLELLDVPQHDRARLLAVALQNRTQKCVAGVPWPDRCGVVTGSADAVAVLWLGPDEFLLVSSDETVIPEELTDRQDREPGALISLATHPLTVRMSRELARAGSFGQVVDLSANRTTLELSGPSARAVLEKGCHVDLHPRAFGPGKAVSTTLGPVQVLLWQVGDNEYRIMPRASFGDYTVKWLLDAMTEFTSAKVA